MMPMLRKSKVCDLLEKFPKAWMCFPKNNVKLYKKNPFCLKKKQEKCIFHHAFWLRISQSRKKKKKGCFFPILFTMFVCLPGGLHLTDKYC